MYALTISQPYASLIVAGDKWVENRKWATKYRGPLVIHAGTGLQYLSADQRKEYPCGLLGICNLVSCVSVGDVHYHFDLYPQYRSHLIPGSKYTWADIAAHPFTEGPWCWVLEDVLKLPAPFPMAGKQRLWSIDPGSEAHSLIVALAAQWDEVDGESGTSDAEYLDG